MQYFFVLGTNPILSIAELSAVFGLNKTNKNKNAKYPMGYLVSNNVFVIETDKKINVNQLIKKLGGTIKIGIMNYELKIKNYDNVIKKTKEIISNKIFNESKGKFKFGISYYGKSKFNIKPLAMEIKKYLHEKQISCRWVTSREPTLSSVVVEQNKLTDKGIEIILIEDKNNILIGQTLTVQPFKELSYRDYGRPARDDRSGMLPPKLAQIMINLASEGEIRESCLLLDPFCGSGTILTEAMLMGYKNIIGSDISKKAISDTKKNIEWIKENYELGVRNYKLFDKSVVELSKFIKPKSVDMIITEPYLGPQRGKFNINRIIKELEQLYIKSLIEFKKVLRRNGRIVMVWPIFIKHKTYNMKYITPNLCGFEIINPIPENLLNNKIIKLTDRNTIIYGRPGQRVWREIIVLKKHK